MAVNSPPPRPVRCASSSGSRGRAILTTGLEHTAKSPTPSSAPKSRKRKSDERDSSLLGLAKTTKPFADHKSKGKPTSETRGKTNGLVANTVESDDSLVILGERSLDLDKAIPRRRSWTPVANHETNDPAEPGSGASQELSSNESPIIFGSLSSMYGYSAGGASSRTISSSSTSFHNCTRRRKVELSHEGARSESQLETQPKTAQKKRPLTITEKATELYRRQSGCGASDTPVEPQRAPKLTDLKPKRKPRAKKNKATAEAKSTPASILTHEESYRAFESQDLLFGTSSQLARDESPSAIRDLQKAISLSLDTVPEVGLGANRSPSLGGQPSGSGSSLALARSSRSLWAEASRDHTGSTVQPEVIDLSDSPYGMARLNLRNSPPLQRQAVGEATAGNIDNEFHDPLLATNTISEISGHGKTAVDPLPAGSAGSRMESVVRRDEAETAETERQPQMPDYNRWTDEELQRKISSYGFKKMRNRKNMIGRLEKCWLSLHPGMEPSVSQAKGSSTKRPQQKSGPKMPKVLNEGAVTPLPTNVEASGDIAAVDQVHLFSKIHEAIVTATPPDDPAELSWHAKILLYDPIIIEDLTVWLNAGHLTRVGVDEEVAPLDVRDWCESRSVCCLWRLNLRGGVRIRF